MSRKKIRKVKGATDRVVIVGAGLAGLSAALRLAGQGREVTILEREPVPGGVTGYWSEMVIDLIPVRQFSPCRT